MKKVIMFIVAVTLSSAVFASGQPKYFQQVNDAGYLVCADESGAKGYNEITVDEFTGNPQKGECANLMGAYFEDDGINLSKADLRGADLREAYLSGAYLSGANMRGANLKGADLSEAYLILANLNEANLIGTNLQGADLRGADLSKTHLLVWAKLNGAKYNDKTILPFDDAEAKRRGMIKVE
ncbi:MAG: pentapeptide repeat-containing protein [Elusimicrobia bacterium]|nr:pentapeptide repeat-containing protein [Elusimicrobiota bacterium]